MKTDNGNLSASLASDACEPVVNSRRWHFLLVGEHGKIITVRRFRGLLITIVTLLAVLVAVALGFGVLYLKTFSANITLQHALTNLQAQVRDIQIEKDILTARLVVAETRLTPEAPAESVAVEGQSAADADGEALPTEETLPAGDTEEPPETVSEPEPEEPDVPAEAPPPTIQEPRRVVVEDLRLTRGAAPPTLKIEFKVRNIRPQDGALAGHTVLILKDAESEDDAWLVLPSVPLVDGRPTGQSGQPFRISRFRVAQLTVEGEAAARRFTEAAIFVFAKNGDLLFEEEFAIGPQG